MNHTFGWYIGIDYSGAQTPRSSLKGLRVYSADRSTAPQEVKPPPVRANTVRAGASLSGWLRGSLKARRRLSASTMVFHSRYNISRSTDCRSTGPLSLMISSAIGPLTKTSMSISSVTAVSETAQLVRATLAGGG